MYRTKDIQQNNNINKTSTIPYNNQGTRHIKSPTKSHYPKRSTTTKLDSHTVRRTNKKKDKKYEIKLVLVARIQIPYYEITITKTTTSNPIQNPQIITVKQFLRQPQNAKELRTQQ